MSSETVVPCLQNDAHKIGATAPWHALAHLGSQNRNFIQVHSEVLKVFECSVLLQSPKELQLTE
jgi:hypothetical protein